MPGARHRHGSGKKLVRSGVRPPTELILESDCRRLDDGDADDVRLTRQLKFSRRDWCLPRIPGIATVAFVPGDLSIK